MYIIMNLGLSEGFQGFTIADVTLPGYMRVVSPRREVRVLEVSLTLLAELQDYVRVVRNEHLHFTCLPDANTLSVSLQSTKNQTRLTSVVTRLFT